MAPRSRPLLALATLVALGLAGNAARAGDDWQKEFKTRFESKNSWEKWKAIKDLLDPNDKDALKFLFKIVKEQDWYLRGAAIEVLAAAFDPKTVDELKKSLKSGEPIIQEGIAIAFGKAKDTSRIEDLLEVLKKTKESKVKRAIVNALKNMPDKRSVPALIELFESEKNNWAVWVHVVDALEKITRQKGFAVGADWKTWWDSVKESWTPEGEGERKEEGGPKTQVRGTDLDFRARGKGKPLLVLPEYGYEKDYLETYLRPLEKSSQVVYMALPALKDFKSPALENAPNAPFPFYPLDRLVQTFEELRTILVKEKKLKDEPFAILGHGLSAWIAVEYARKYKVSGIVLVSPQSGGAYFGKGIERMIAKGKEVGDIELEHAGLGRQLVNGKANYEIKSREEADAIHRRQFTIYFADWRDLEIGRLWGPMVEKGEPPQPMAQCQRPMGGVVIDSNYSVFKGGEVPCKALLISGTFGLEASPEDTDQMMKVFPKGKHVTFDKSGRMPFVEENDKFTKLVESFVAK